MGVTPGCWLIAVFNERVSTAVTKSMYEANVNEQQAALHGNDSNLPQ
jgi:hypothetical protein